MQNRSFQGWSSQPISWLVLNRTEQNIFICLNKVTQFTTDRKHNRQAARKALWLNNAGGPIF